MPTHLVNSGPAAPGISWCRRILRCALPVAVLILVVVAGLDATPASARIKQFDCPDLQNPEKRPLMPMVQGYDGWFFRERSAFVDSYFLMTDTRAYLRRLAEALKARGTIMALALVPSRGLLYLDAADTTEGSPSVFSSSMAEREFDLFIEELRDLGLVVPNLREVAQRQVEAGVPFYFKRDHHWTPQGARAAAQEVARELRETGDFDKFATKTYETEEVGEFLWFGGMPEEIARLCADPIPPEESIEFRTFEAVMSADSLFGDVAEVDSIILVGTSFSSVDLFNFDGFLAEATGVSVTNHAIAGGMFLGSILSYLHSAAFDQAPPGILLWETPSYYDINLDTGVVFRQMIAAARGACTGPAVVLEDRLGLSGAAGGLDIPADLRIAGHNYYLFAEIDDPLVKKFTFALDYHGGDGEWVPVDRSGRLVNHGRFFLELTDEIDGALARVSLEYAGETNAVANVRLCRKASPESH